MLTHCLIFDATLQRSVILVPSQESCISCEPFFLQIFYYYLLLFSLPKLIMGWWWRRIATAEKTSPRIGTASSPPPSNPLEAPIDPMIDVVLCLIRFFVWIFVRRHSWKLEPLVPSSPPKCPLWRLRQLSGSLHQNRIMSINLRGGSLNFPSLFLFIIFFYFSFSFCRRVWPFSSLGRWRAHRMVICLVLLSPDSSAWHTS